MKMSTKVVIISIPVINETRTSIVSKFFTENSGKNLQKEIYNKVRELSNTCEAKETNKSLRSKRDVKFATDRNEYYGFSQHDVEVLIADVEDRRFRIENFSEIHSYFLKKRCFFCEKLYPENNLFSKKVQCKYNIDHLTSIFFCKNCVNIVDTVDLIIAE